jgi:hypothetical protein
MNSISNLSFGGNFRDTRIGFQRLFLRDSELTLDPGSSVLSFPRVLTPPRLHMRVPKTPLRYSVARETAVSWGRE